MRGCSEAGEMEQLIAEGRDQLRDLHASLAAIDKRRTRLESLQTGLAMTLEEMRAHLEVDSLGFLSVDGLYDAMEAGPRDPRQPQFTDHYFTGEYPTRLLDREIEEGGREVAARQLSLLVSA